MNTTTVYDFYSDPSHGWLKVAREELETLGILDKISAYSYQRDNFVYLEEDLDAGVFLNAKAEMVPEFKDKLKFREHTANRSSRIRNYRPFSVNFRR